MGNNEETDTKMCNYKKKYESRYIHIYSCVLGPIEKSIFTK